MTCRSLWNARAGGVSSASRTLPFIRARWQRDPDSAVAPGRSRLQATASSREEEDAANEELKGILAFSEEPLVSVDFRKNDNSSIVDAEYTKVIGGNLVKVLSWYDNEWGYSCRVRDLVKFIAQKGL